MFNIIVSGGEMRSGTEQTTTLDRFHQVDGENFNKVKNLVSMKLGRSYHKTIYCKGEIYVFVGNDNSEDTVLRVDKYSLITNTWKHVTDMPANRDGCCACAFMNKIFIIGGCFFKHFYNCLTFDTKQKKWNEVAKMKEAGAFGACAIFQGKVVFSGGMSYKDERTAVQAYDHAANTWSYMPKMIEERIGHSSVACKNKLFVIGSIHGNGSETCEVFDSTCNKFVFLKQKPNSVKFSLSNQVQAFSIGSKLIALGHDSATAVCYDVEKEEWSEESCGVTENINHFGCTAVPKM